MITISISSPLFSLVRVGGYRSHEHGHIRVGVVPKPIVLQISR